jgi:hypothetical protein
VLVWPKTTASVLLLVIATGITTLWLSVSQRGRPAPIPAERVLRIMRKEVDERSADMRAKLEAQGDPIPGQVGVFEAIAQPRPENQP